ncbi:hypothetical protein AK36_2641 [Burkholderia vietnamiensis LMG 10929]|nr:hypothetical protein AK36_2641 [Burkholderia vietnamiensis LMG 10929]
MTLVYWYLEILRRNPFRLINVSDIWNLPVYMPVKRGNGKGSTLKMTPLTVVQRA